MRLTPHEQERLLIHVAAGLARLGPTGPRAGLWAALPAKAKHRILRIGMWLRSSRQSLVGKHPECLAGQSLFLA